MVCWHGGGAKEIGFSTDLRRLSSAKRECVKGSSRTTDSG